MLLRIVSAEGELYRGEVQKVLLPTLTGILGILPNHMNLVTPLISGSISYLPAHITEKSAIDSFSDHSINIDIGGGLCVIDDDSVTITVE